MKTLVAQVRGWDGPVWRDDAVELFVDVGHTHKNYFQFIINPLGTGYDGKNLDPLWSGKWRCAAKCGPDRWTIEAAIPFPSMDLPTPAQSTLWGFNACRERRASGDVQLLNWADVQGNFHRPHLYGHILYLDGPWETAKPDTQAIAASLGAYRLFTPGGYWDIDPKGTIKEITYRSIVEEKIKTVPTMASLQKDIGDEGSELILMRFQPIEDEVSRIRKLLGTQKSVQAEDWAVSLATLDQVTGQFGDIYWRIKLDLLLKEM
jgi:hypothetical protein